MAGEIRSGDRLGLGIFMEQGRFVEEADEMVFGDA